MRNASPNATAPRPSAARSTPHAPRSATAPHTRTGLVVGLALALTTLLGATGLDAQDWRTVTSFRKHTGEQRLDVEVQYGAGRLRIEPASGDDLYRAVMKYDAETFDPLTSFRNGRLRLGVEGSHSDVRLRNHEAGDLEISLSPAVPADIELQFGAVEADLELGGLRVRSLEIHTGASESDVHFSRPNPIRCERIELRLGAASFEMRGLGNANAERLEVQGGVGDVVLDFSGDWRGDMDADITMALGTVTLRLPRDLGVRVEKDTFLTSLDTAGFTKRRDEYYSESWEGADRRLTIRLSGALGTVDVEWLDGSSTR